MLADGVERVTPVFRGVQLQVPDQSSQASRKAQVVALDVAFRRITYRKHERLAEGKGEGGRKQPTGALEDPNRIIGTVGVLQLECGLAIGLLVVETGAK